MQRTIVGDSAIDDTELSLLKSNSASCSHIGWNDVTANDGVKEPNFTRGVHKHSTTQFPCAMGDLKPIDHYIFPADGHCITIAIRRDCRCRQSGHSQQ